MIIQKQIQDLMVERGWSEYRLAKESNLSQTTIANMFKRNNAPTLPTLEAVCNAFGLTLSQFFAEGNDPIELTDQQKELFKRWATLNDTQKKILLDLMNNMQ